MPFEKTSRSPRLPNWRGKNRSRASSAARRGKPWNDVLAARTRIAKVVTWTTQNMKPNAVLAANTSFQGFPRLAALLARDRFFPRQFGNLGDRLVFSNGIIVLAAVASALLVVYNASVDSLIHLYVIGVFTAFTLSQAGMVRYW